MLREMTWQEFLGWRHFDALDPPLERLAPVLAGQIVHALVNLQRNPRKKPQPYPLKDFVMLFGDDMPAGPTRKQTWQEQKAMLSLLLLGGAKPGETQPPRRRRKAQ